MLSISEDGALTPETMVGYHGNIEIRALLNPPESPRDAGLALRNEPSVLMKFANADVTVRE
ncbi:MAG TPA: hypothetical protein VJP86_00020 [Vicinamibacterales bacterium]|jgi:hypothetical protein|nr:hypothetical protein [Vicinamibacterales bacterium]